MYRVHGSLKAAWAGCLLLIVAAGGVSSETLTPVRDSEGQDIGAFELWKKKKLSGKKKFFVPVGWVAYLNGYEGEVLVKRVEGSSGFGLKGTVQQVNHHGNRAQIPPRLEAGSKFEPFQNFIRGNGVPIATRHGKIRGRYQFHAKNGSGFHFFLRMYKAGVEIGQAFWLTKAEVEEWQAFELPISYFNNQVPDRCYITVDIFGKQTGNRFDAPAKGSFYLIDELTFVD